jgi:hypothetical protein
MKVIALIVLISVLIIISVYLFILGKKEKYWGFRGGPRRGFRGGWRYPRRGFYGGYPYNNYPFYLEDSEDNGSCECVDGKPINDNCVDGNIPFCSGNICKCGK